MDIGVYEIDKWHKEKGYISCGYHYVIKRNGHIEKGRKDKDIGAHCKGENLHSIGICLIGGVDDAGNSENNFTESQFNSLKKVVEDILSRHKKAEVKGHNFFNKNKDCPCFNVENWWQNICSE